MQFMLLQFLPSRVFPLNFLYIPSYVSWFYSNGPSNSGLLKNCITNGHGKLKQRLSRCVFWNGSSSRGKTRMSMCLKHMSIFKHRRTMELHFEPTPKVKTEQQSLGGVLCFKASFQQAQFQTFCSLLYAFLLQCLDLWKTLFKIF